MVIYRHRKSLTEIVIKKAQLLLNSTVLQVCCLLVFVQHLGYSQTTVIASGVGGHTSGQMLHRINGDVLDHNPTLTLVLAGTNDMLNPGKITSFEVFEANLRSIISKLIAGNSEILLMTAPPCIESVYLEDKDPALFAPEGPNGRLDKANEIITQVALENDLLLVDMHTLFANDLSLISNDALHPNTAGYDAMVELLHLTIEENCLPSETIVCFGNSITRNYSPIFAEKVAEDPFDCIVVSTCNNRTAKIEAECYDQMFGIKEGDVTTGGESIGFIENGDWTVYNNIDLTDVYSVQAIASSGGSGGFIEVHLDALEGELLAVIPVSSTGNWQMFLSTTINIGLVDGVHDIYLVFTGGEGYLLDLDWVGFSGDVVCNTAEKIEAECHDEMSGIQSEGCSEGTKNIGWINTGDWAMYNNIDLTNAKSIKARVSGKTEGSIIEVHLDAVDGDVIAEIPVTNTNGNQIWVSDSANIVTTTGTHDVYMVFKGEGNYLFNVNYFSFLEDEIVVTDLSNKLEGLLDIYPNPATDELKIYSETKGPFKVELINYLGQSVLKAETILNQEVSLDISFLDAGVYIIEIVNDQGIVTRSMIKE